MSKKPKMTNSIKITWGPTYVLVSLQPWILETHIAAKSICILYVCNWEIVSLWRRTMWNWLRGGWIAMLLLLLLGCTSFADYGVTVHRLASAVICGASSSVVGRSQSPKSPLWPCGTVCSTSLKWGCRRESCDWPKVCFKTENDF